MKAKIFLICVVIAILSLSGYAKVKIFHDSSNFWSAYSEFNHNNVHYYFVDAEFESVTYLQMEVILPVDKVPKNLASVSLELAEDHHIYKENPEIDIRDNIIAVVIKLDQTWDLFGALFGALVGEDGYSYSASVAIQNMEELSKYDIKSIEFKTKDDKVTKIAITYPTAGMFREMFKALISATQADKTYGQTAKEFFAPYLKEFPLNGTAKSTTKTPSSSSTSTTSKTSTNNTTTSKSSASTSSTSKSTSTTNKKSVSTSTTQKESSYFNVTGKVVNQKGAPIQACIQPLPGGDIITTGTDGCFTLRYTHKGAVVHFWIKGRFTTCKDITITRQMEKEGLTVRLTE